MSDKELKKILIVGLDQAGKTSILNVLQEKYNKMDNIKPTVGIERTEIKIFGISVLAWDLGGQQKFRQEYLKNPKNFENTDSLFFVIDALNSSRYDEALQYFTEILEIIEKLDTRPQIVLLIHKIDPNIREDPNNAVIIETLKQLFFTAGYQLSVFTTSIYDRQTIIEAFSRCFQEIIQSLQPIKKLLESLALLLKLDAAILFDEHLMILNEHYKTKEIEEVCLSTVYNSIYYMTHTNPKLGEHVLKNFELVLNVKGGAKRFNFLEVAIKGLQMFLLTMSDETIDTHTVFEKFNSMAHIFEKKI